MAKTSHSSGRRIVKQHLNSDKATLAGNSQRNFKATNNVISDEVAHYELPHLDLHCMQGRLLFFGIFKPFVFRKTALDIV